MKPLRRTGLHLLLEPGRSIVAASGALLTRTLYTKENGGKQFLVVDAAMNDLGPAFALRSASRNCSGNAAQELCRALAGGVMDVVGPVCETGDFFARERDLPPVAPGDLLAILDAGAYGMSLSSNYNTRGRAAEVLVDGKKARLVRRRETFEDLIHSEI